VNSGASAWWDASLWGEGDICSHLWDEHLGDELHPNETEATIIAGTVFEVLSLVHDAE